VSLVDHHGVRAEQGHKRVRGYLGGELVVDTVRPMLVWEHARYPAYYFPAEDVRAELLPVPADVAGPVGDGTVFDIVVATGTAAGAAVRFHDPPALRPFVRIDWNAMEEWLEEDEPVYVHPRDPYTRVDILASSRQVEVWVDGVIVAESRQPRILFETGHPPRFYLPLTGLRQDLLRRSATLTRCPYKGTAEYFSVVTSDTVHSDLVWIYRSPLPESAKIAGLACFYSERVQLLVDGVPV
jgi:uncharacterized protein (DUF427 family)